MSPRHIIDAHTHIFNARYMPLEGIVRGATSIGWLARLTDRLVNRVTGSAQSDEVGEALSAKMAALHIAPTDTSAIEELVVRHVAAVVRKLEPAVSILRAKALSSDTGSATASREVVLQVMLDDELLPILIEIDERYHAENRPGPEDGAPVDLVTAVEEAAAEDGGVEKGRRRRAALAERVGREVHWLLEKVIREAPEALKDYVRFFFQLVRTESKVVQHLEQQYAEEPRLAMYFHFLMDMELAYDPADEPWYPFWQQLQRLHLQNVRSDGRLVGFGAFDPRRPDWERYVSEAIRLGFVGIKFYPAMGYRPAGNDDLAIERTMDNFFAWCVEHDVPVVSHCTPTGFEARKGWGVNADPLYWALRLGKCPKLRLCLLHAGGAEQKNGEVKSPGWFAPDANAWAEEQNYARKVVELCRRNERVWCEISHFHEAIGNAGFTGRLRANILEQLGTPAASGEIALSERIMYGSDWHMPRIIEEADDYLDLFLEIMADPSMAPHREGFFWRNAIAFLDVEAWSDRLRRWPGVSPSTLEYASAVRRRVDRMLAG